MGQGNNDDWEHVDITAIIDGIIGNGVISGLEVAEGSPSTGMLVNISAGQCTIDGVVYTESSAQNVNIADETTGQARKDIIIYDATAGNPAVITGTAAAAPIPEDVPDGDILLGIVLVDANEVTSILNADITDDRVYSNVRYPYTTVSAPSTILTDANGVVTVDASGGTRTITLPTSVGSQGKIFAIKKIDSTTNTIAVTGNGTETIDGDTSKTLSNEWDSIIIQSDGANWFALAKDKTDAEVKTAYENSGLTGVPTGVILMWHGLLSAVPTGWTLCDGTSGTPDMRAKFARGAPAATNPGSTGGADTHTLTVAEMPSHTHRIGGDNTDGGGSDVFDRGYVRDGQLNYTDSRGDGGAHNNMPAYYEIAYIMKT